MLSKASKLFYGIRGAFYDVKNGIYGVWYWIPFAWKWRPWDWAFGLLALKHHLIKSEKCLQNGFVVCGKRNAKDIKKAIILIDRIIEESYLLDAAPDCISEDKWHRLRVKQSEDDWNYFLLLIRKHMRKWWD